MQLFNRVMALVGFASTLGVLALFAIADQAGAGALRVVMQLAAAFAPAPPLSF